MVGLIPGKRKRKFAQGIPLEMPVRAMISRRSAGSGSQSRIMIGWSSLGHEKNCSIPIIISVLTSLSSRQILRATAVPVGTACWSRRPIGYGNSICLSVCPSATTRYRIKPRWDRDSGFSPNDSLQSLVSNEEIWCRCARRFPSNGGIKEG